jgi:GTP-binding protein YchF
MALSIGIVGLPNVGKSTLFNAMVRSELAQVANFAFTTIEPNVGIVEVPDDRLEKLAQIEDSDRIVPATIKFVDIAGLIAGAAKGEGLGNKFLSHIREVDAIAMVVRTFENKDVMHVADKIDPRSDIETIVTELALSDLETVSKKRITLEKEARSGSKEATSKVAILTRAEAALSQAKPINSLNLTLDEIDLIKECNFLTVKPFVYVFNVDEMSASKSPEEFIEKFSLQEYVGNDSAVVISAKIEQELSVLDPADGKQFLTDLGLDEPGLNRLVKIAYKTLNLQSFFTAGPMETRAWTIEIGQKAPQAAGKIHTDFENKFIKAEVISYEDFVAIGGWAHAKERGKARLEGKDYVVRDGDVVFIFHGK